MPVTKAEKEGSARGAPRNRPKEVTMARYSRSSSRSGSYHGGGFTNSRTGSYVSSARAHQRTGQSFGGYTKTHNASTGHYSMRPSGRRW